MSRRIEQRRERRATRGRRISDRRMLSAALRAYDRHVAGHLSGAVERDEAWRVTYRALSARVEHYGEAIYGVQEVRS
jgi:hypothetical protein